MTRCKWVSDDPLYIDYHDNEWGVPLHEDNKLFEMLTLEGAQAGLSWITVLRKRTDYNKLFHNFNIQKVANMTDKELQEILLDPRIIRNKLKIYGTRKNAIATLKIIKESGSLNNYLWKFVNHKPILNAFKKHSDIPTQTPLSTQISKDLKKRGFTFVGPTIIYAFMQAIGMVNDHTTDCHCYPHKNA